MRPELETYHLIDRYLKNELEGNELSDFEYQMKSDPSFASEVEMQKLVNHVVIGASYQDLRNTMRQDLTNKNQNQSIFKKWWFWTSSILLLLMILWQVFQTNSAEKATATVQTNSEIKEETFQPKVSNQHPVSVQPYKEETSPTMETSKPNMSTKTKEQATIAKVEIQDEASLVKENVKIETIPTEVSPIQNTLTPENSKIPSEEKPDCKTSSLHLEPKIEAACLGEKNGKIVFPSTNHSKTILISLKGTKTGAQTAFYNLGSGDHTFYILDEKGCNFTQQVHIPEKSCKSNKFAFNPDMGDAWKLPVSSNEEFNLTIVNRGGQLVYQHSTSQGQINEWSGISSQGNQVEPGMYIYVIEYADGRKESGQVSILK